MYQANYEATQQGDPSKIIFEDTSTGDETPTSRKLQITKTDLVVEEYEFEEGETTLEVDGFDKDYALSTKFIAEVDVEDEDSTYTKEYDFAMLGYTKKGFTKRKIDLEVDESIVDVRAHKEQSNELIYYMRVAEDNIRFSDLIGSQKALDYMAEIISAGVNSN